MLWFAAMVSSDLIGQRTPVLWQSGWLSAEISHWQVGERCVSPAVVATD